MIVMYFTALFPQPSQYFYLEELHEHNYGALLWGGGEVTSATSGFGALHIA